MYFQSTGCDSLASGLTLDYNCWTVLLTWVWGQSLVQMDINKQWHLDAYVSRLITREGCAETISMVTNRACHYACTHVQILAGLQVCYAALKTAHPPHNAP